MCYCCVLSTAELLSCAAVAKFILCAATAANVVCYWWVRMLLVHAAVLSEY